MEITVNGNLMGTDCKQSLWIGIIRALNDCMGRLFRDIHKSSGPSCSKLTTSLVNVSLKFQTLISQMHQYFLLKKCEKLLQCKSFSHFFNKKYQYNWL